MDAGGKPMVFSKISRGLIHGSTPKALHQALGLSRKGAFKQSG